MHMDRGMVEQSVSEEDPISLDAFDPLMHCFEDVLINHQVYEGYAVERKTRGYRLFAGLDLTYELLAHVVRDGQVIGMLIEPAIGRPVEFRDRTKACFRCILL
jgi:hypothetical protein